MEKQLIIYDCDGVLFDSREAVLGYYDFVCEKFNLPKIDRDNPLKVQKAMMNTNEEILSMLTDSKELLSEMLEFAKHMNFQKFLNLMKPEPFIEETLVKLEKIGVSIAIFTNRGYSLNYLLEHFHLERYFKYKVTSLDVKSPKPDPEGLNMIFNYFNIAPENSIYIGDSETDYLAAKSSKTPFIGYKNRFNDSLMINKHLEIFNFL